MKIIIKGHSGAMFNVNVDIAERKQIRDVRNYVFTSLCYIKINLQHLKRRALILGCAPPHFHYDIYTIYVFLYLNMIHNKTCPD